MSKPQLERRFLTGEVVTDLPTRTVRGYAATYNKLSLDLGGFREIIRPGAFDRTLADGTDVKALIAHNTEKCIGRRKNDTLKLSSDDTGLRLEIALPDTQEANSLATSMARGDVDGCSFAFQVRPNGERWKRDGAATIRELLDIELIEVSVGVVFPAYPDAGAAVRSLKEWQEQQAASLHRYKLRQRLAEWF